jgi:hypothetical protein
LHLRKQELELDVEQVQEHDHGDDQQALTAEEQHIAVGDQLEDGHIAVPGYFYN